MARVHSFPGSDIDVMSKVKLERQLTDAEVDTLGISIVPPVDTKRELGWTEASLIRIPYWGITGEKLLDNRGNQLCRYRRTVLNDKGERYTQRAGTGARHYLPRTVDWNHVSKDPTVDIYYTEGEFKAIAASRELGPCVGNAGVTSWRGINGALAAPLDEFVWKERNVYIVYDAEATSTASVPLKANIEKALGELAVELIIRGARVKSLLIAKTPTFVDGKKLGVDDYFAAGGSREALLATAIDPKVDEDLARMFRRYAIYRGTKPHIKDIINGKFYTGKEFADYIETQTRIKDGKAVKLANLYREHQDANWFSDYVFDPSLQTGYIHERHLFNTWQGFAAIPEFTEPSQGYINDFLTFSREVWGPDNVDFFLDWVAHIFQRPAELTTISPLLVSRVKGVGKSLTGAIVRALIGTRSSYVGSVDGLTEKHTGEQEGKLFVQVDEADALFDGKEERLKALDSDEIRIRKMNTDGYTVPNYMRKFFTTNKDAAFRISADERRYFIVRVCKTHKDGEPGAEWNVWLRSTIVPMLKNEEARNSLMWFFMQRDISQWDPTAPVPRTQDMMDMVQAGESKKSVMADQLWERLEPMGIFTVNSTLNAIDNKLWGEVKAILRDTGGKIVSHVYKDEKNDAKSVSVCMTAGNILRTVDVPKKGPKLEAGQISGETIRAKLLKTKAMLDEVRALIDSGKF